MPLQADVSQITDAFFVVKHKFLNHFQGKLLVRFVAGVPAFQIFVKERLVGQLQVECLDKNLVQIVVPVCSVVMHGLFQ